MSNKAAREPMDGNAQPTSMATPVVLVAGFGALLALMATAGVDSVRALHEVQATNAQIHSEYLSRARNLQHIGEALYQSASVVRDYILLDPGQKTSEMLRVELKMIRAGMDSTLRDYSRTLKPDEEGPFRALNTELDAYWSVLNPIFGWSDTDRQDHGYWFLRQEVFPRRTAVLKIAQSIETVNDRTFNEGQGRVAQVFFRFQRRLKLFTWIALGIGLAVSAVSISYILRLEAKACQRYDESLRVRRELKDLSARLVDAQEQERRTIARDLHDEVGQSLSALLMDLNNLEAAAPSMNGPFRERLDNIKGLAKNSVEAVRNMSLLLRPSMLDDLGLPAALEWQAREVRKRTGMRVYVVEENVPERLPESHKTCIYRVVQEALHNCSKHAAARTVHIRLRQEAQLLVLMIEDDGKGFDAQRVRGLGLIGMMERVAHAGGTFRVESKPDHGTLLQVQLPLAEALHGDCLAG